MWTTAETDFGQTDFGHPYLTDFGQNLGGRLWPNRLWPKLVFQSYVFLFQKKKEQQDVGPHHGLHPSQEGGASKGGALEGWGPEVWEKGSTLANPVLAILIWPILANFGQSNFWPIHFWIWCVSWWGPKMWGSEMWGGPNFRAFFPLRPHFRSVSLSLWVSSRGILVVFEAPEPSNVHVWSSRSVV